MFIKRSLKVLIIVIVAFAFTSVTYAFAASNTGIPNQKAGDGAGTITGYAISGVAYTLAANPQQIASVTFNLNADATTVKIKLVAAGSTWYDCTVTHSGLFPASCTTAGATVVSADELRVVAADH
jgi:hypothetical protein